MGVIVDRMSHADYIVVVDQPVTSPWSAADQLLVLPNEPEFWTELAPWAR